MRLDVFFRSCSRVASFHGTPRPAGMTKAELAVRCLATVVDSLGQALAIGLLTEATLTLIDDHSDPECVAALTSILTHSPFPARLIAMTETGNGPSLGIAYREARQHAPELIYFVEDDYLHAPEAIHEMLGAYVQGTQLYGRDVAVFPCDYPDLYRYPQVSPVILSPQRYWRVVTSSTGTFMITRAVLESHWDCYQRLTLYGIDATVNEGNSINLVYQEHPCLSPMPSLAVHMHEGMYSPYVPWRSWWERAAPIVAGWSQPRMVPESGVAESPVGMG